MTKVEEVLNNGVGCPGTLVKDTAGGATYALDSGVPDRESNETRFLREATEMIEAWQRRLQSGQSIPLVSTMT